MKKTEVYVKIDTPKKAKKLKRVLDMFGESVPREINLGLSTGFYPDGDSQLEYPYLLIDEHKEWAAYCKKPKRKTKVSIKELRNILAKDHLKAGDVCLFSDGKGFECIGVFSEYSDVYTDFLVSKVPGKDSVRYGFHYFIRYATEEEKALLEPVNNFTNSDIAIIERLHDTLLDNHGYSLGSKLLTDARYLASKIKSNIK